jgi:hypothetical protein
MSRRAGGDVASSGWRCRVERAEMSRRAGGDVASSGRRCRQVLWRSRYGPASPPDVLDHEEAALRSPGVARTPASALKLRAGGSTRPARRSRERRQRGGRRRCPCGRETFPRRTRAAPSRQERGGTGASVCGRAVHRRGPPYSRNPSGGRRDPRRRLVAARPGTGLVSGGSRARGRAGVRRTVRSHGPAATALSPNVRPSRPDISTLSTGHLYPLDRTSLPTRPDISALSTGHLYPLDRTSLPTRPDISTHSTGHSRPLDRTSLPTRPDISARSA